MRGWGVRSEGVEGDIPPACTMCCTCTESKGGRAMCLSPLQHSTYIYMRKGLGTVKNW